MICNKPFTNLLVKEDGSAYICCYLAEPHLSLGNLNVQSFDEIWNSEPARLLRVEMIEDILPRACSHCPYYSQSAAVSHAIHTPARWGGGEAKIDTVMIRSARGETRESFERGETIEVRLECSAKEPISAPVLGIALYHESGRRYFGTNTALDGIPLHSLQGNGIASISLPTDFLVPGRFLIDLAIHSPAQYHYDYLQCQHGFGIIPAPHGADAVAEPRVAWAFSGGFQLG